MRRPALRVVVAAALCAVAAGCGLGAGEPQRGVSITVTRDFGGRSLGAARAGRAPGGETVMRFLQRNFRVSTRYGGGFVQAIDGVSGGRRDGRPVDWFYYVNGIEAPMGAAATRVHAGDRIWWDFHRWDAAMSIPAVVGSYPEPFRSGTGGRRLPVTIGCAKAAGGACDEVKRRLSAVGVPVASGLVGAPSGAETARVLVGTWTALRLDPVARLLERGPAASGVYLRVAGGGRRFVALDPAGHPAVALPPGTGVIAATRQRSQQPTWVVTGGDAAGVLAAARGLDERRLRNRFALALSPGRALGLPVTGSQSGV